MKCSSEEPVVHQNDVVALNWISAQVQPVAFQFASNQLKAATQLHHQGVAPSTTPGQHGFSAATFLSSVHDAAVYFKFVQISLSLFFSDMKNSIHIVRWLKAIDEAYYRQYCGGENVAQPVPPRRARRERGPAQSQTSADTHEAEPFQMRDMYMSLIGAQLQSIHRGQVATAEMIVGMYDTPPAHRWTMDEFHNVVAWPEDPVHGGGAGAAETSAREMEEDEAEEEDAFDDDEDEEEEEDTGRKNGQRMLTSVCPSTEVDIRSLTSNITKGKNSGSTAQVTKCLVHLLLANARVGAFNIVLPMGAGRSFDFIDEGVCFVLPQVRSEDFVGCNFFEWCTEELIDSRNVVNVEDSSASARNEEVGRSLMKMEQSVMKMEERDV
ncbi:hypothetical protein LR48_Vigan09g048900 [Vigna angularis]|uniref:Uncharacterized protein n=1 Tax=Phaseolus angularis TaxID=3914 RepID=A0A0L9V9Q6_PHAAN|nr:hypothetical protein LR48_Vigan09g048900 [Vigna angularis]